MPGVVGVLPEGGHPSSLPLACPFDWERENSLGIFEKVGWGSKISNYCFGWETPTVDQLKSWPASVSLMWKQINLRKKDSELGCLS